MPTLRQIKKVARLECQVGDARPGFLRENVCAVEGPSTTHYTPVLSRSKRVNEKDATRADSGVRITMSYREDTKTGRRRIRHE